MHAPRQQGFQRKILPTKEIPGNGRGCGRTGHQRKNLRESKLYTVVSGFRSCCQMVSKVEKQVLESNPLLEAFGNARTLRLVPICASGSDAVLQCLCKERQLQPLWKAPSRKPCFLSAQAALAEVHRAAIPELWPSRDAHFFGLPWPALCP